MGQTVMKAFVVLNPAAGQEIHQSVREALAEHFGPSRIEYEVHETRKGDKIGEIVRARLRDGIDLVVAAGGDGTVSDVIDGLTGSPIPLGIIPTGTGNLVARDLGIPNEIDEAVGLIAGAPRSRKIDAMRIGERVFVLNISAGYSASVISGTTQGNKHRFGRIAYVWAMVSKMFTSRPRGLVVTVDGIGHEYRAFEVAIMNCGMLAKMLYPKGPEIRIDDGRLDVFVLGMRTIRDYPRDIFGILTGRHAIRVSRYLKANRGVAIRSDVPLPVQADGDIIGTTPIEVELLPGAVTVLVPEEHSTALSRGVVPGRSIGVRLPSFSGLATLRKVACGGSSGS
jgi:YegS/Rv2252/BmrU family lipid kinase